MERLANKPQRLSSLAFPVADWRRNPMYIARPMNGRYLALVCLFT